MGLARKLKQGDLDQNSFSGVVGTKGRREGVEKKQGGREDRNRGNSLGKCALKHS